VCQPYVATDVSRKIETSDRLTVVNAEDLAEALVRLHLKKLDPGRFLNWITTPGQPRYEELNIEHSKKSMERYQNLWSHSDLWSHSAAMA